MIIGNLMTIIAFSGISDAQYYLIVDSYFGILEIISVIISIYIMGYGVSIIKNSDSAIMPDFNIKKDFINAFKYIAVSAVYLIVPILIFVGLCFLFGLTSYGFDVVSFSFTNTTDGYMMQVDPTFEIALTLIISFIVFLIFGLFEIVGVCRLAKFDSLKESFNFKEVLNDVKRLKWRLICGIIIIFFISLTFGFILSLINFLHYGDFIYGFIISLVGYAYLMILYYRFIGLLYTE